MKNNYIYILLIVLAFTACKKGGLAKYDIEKSFQDPAVTLEDLKKQIAAGTDGFRMTIEPSTGKYYGGYIGFDGTSNAKYVLDNGTANATTPADTKYSLSLRKTNAVLSLGTTTSSFAVLAKTLGGIDSTYTYQSVKGDTLRFVGDLLGSKLTLIKTSKANATEYLAGKLNQSISNVAAFNNLKYYFKQLTIGSKSYDILINTTAKVVAINYATGSSFKRFYTLFAYTNNGVIFKTPLSDGTNTIAGLDALVIDAAKNTATTVVKGENATITAVNAPVFYETTAAQKWYTQMAVNFNGAWVSDKAFHANGVDDFCNFKAVTNYQNLWYAGSAVFGGTSEGLIAYTGALSTPYCFSKTPFTVNASGIARFTLLSSSGTFTGTTASALAWTAARNIMYGGAVVNTSYQDWYLVQSTPDGLNYDMVKYGDASVWINWRPRQ